MDDWETQKKYWTVEKINKLSGKKYSIMISTDKDAYPVERTKEILEEIYPDFEIKSVVELTE